MHEEAIRKADVLIEAMGFIRKFHGKFTVIKLGGSVMEDPESLRALAGRRRLHADSRYAAGHRPRRRQGDHGGDGEGRPDRRTSCKGGASPTSPRSTIVARVLAEEINADIERHINKFGGRASGLHHKTHQCLYGRKLVAGKWARRAGSISAMSARSPRWTCRPIENLCLAGVVPVLPSLAEDEQEEGRLLNVNADTAAAAVAQAHSGREARLLDRHRRHLARQE